MFWVDKYFIYLQILSYSILVFLNSCIEKWLQNPKNKSCPQCKSAAKRKDIRNIYAKSVKVLDTTDREQ